jgi:hypothetical protein
MAAGSISRQVVENATLLPSNQLVYLSAKKCYKRSLSEAKSIMVYEIDPVIIFSSKCEFVNFQKARHISCLVSRSARMRTRLNPFNANKGDEGRGNQDATGSAASAYCRHHTARHRQ